MVTAEEQRNQYLNAGSGPGQTNTVYHLNSLPVIDLGKEVVGSASPDFIFENGKYRVISPEEKTSFLSNGYTLGGTIQDPMGGHSGAGALGSWNTALADPNFAADRAAYLQARQGAGYPGQIISSGGKPGASTSASFTDRGQTYQGTQATGFSGEAAIRRDAPGPTTRLPGESVADFTKRFDNPNPDLLDADYLKINSNLTPEQLKQMQTVEAANRDKFAQTGTNGGSTLNTGNVASGGISPQSGGISSTTGGAMSPSALGGGGGYTPPAYKPAVGSSFSERFKDFQKELGIGAAPMTPDSFTNQDQQKLSIAQQERAAIDTELTSIMDERMRLEDEFRKFSDEQVGLPEAGRMGAISEEGRALERQYNTLNRRELVLEAKLRNRNNTISELKASQRLEYEDAVSAYNQQFSRSMQMYQLFDQEQDEMKQNAKANLDVYSSALQAQIESGQISQLSGTQRARLEEMETQAGLPVGSTMAVLGTLKPTEEKLYQTFDESTGVYQYFYRDASGKIGMRQATGAASPTSSTNEQYTLSPGQVRYDGTGKVVASVPKTSTETPTTPPTNPTNPVNNSSTRQPYEQWHKEYLRTSAGKALAAKYGGNNIELSKQLRQVYNSLGTVAIPKSKYTATTIPTNIRSELTDDIQKGASLTELYAAYPDVSTSYISSHYNTLKPKSASLDDEFNSF